MFRNLNAEQARYDLTNEQMAGFLGITRKTYETKKATGNVTFHEIKKLCDRFGESFDYLFETEEDRAKKEAG